MFFVIEINLAYHFQVVMSEHKERHDSLSSEEDIDEIFSTRIEQNERKRDIKFEWQRNWAYKIH